MLTVEQVINRVNNADDISDWILTTEEVGEEETARNIITSLFRDGRIHVIPIVVPLEAKKWGYRDVQWVKLLIEARATGEPVFDKYRLRAVNGPEPIPMDQS